jgi:amino acid permease
MYLVSFLKMLMAKWFDSLVTLTVAGSVAAWTLICATYLQFRLAARKQPGTEDAIPKEAKSPFQPYLAIYGLVLSSILRSHPTTSVHANPQSCFRGSSFASEGIPFSRGMVQIGLTMLLLGLPSC